MTKLYFDHPRGIVLIDGKREENGCCIDKKEFSVQYIPFDCEYSPIICAVDSRLVSTPQLLIIKHKTSLILKFCPVKKDVYEDCYLQKTLKIENTVHILSCKAERTHIVTLETQNEIISLPLPSKPEDLHLNGEKISSGQLLMIKAKLGKKTYLAVIHYGDDYTLVMSLCCDKTYIDDGKIVVEDYLYDCLQRKCVRVLKFCDDAFVEESRHFEYDSYPDYPDELVPYVFLESLSAKDEDMISRYLSPSMRDSDYKTILGNYVGICDCTEYSPYKVNLVYSDEKGLYTKTFYFEVSGGRINYVNCL